jgi:hypothetical protein
LPEVIFWEPIYINSSPAVKRKRDKLRSGKFLTKCYALSTLLKKEGNKSLPAVASSGGLLFWGEPKVPSLLSF